MEILILRRIEKVQQEEVSGANAAASSRNTVILVYNSWLLVILLLLLQLALHLFRFPLIRKLLIPPCSYTLMLGHYLGVHFVMLHGTVRRLSV